MGSLSRNYIPVNELQGSIQIRITLVNAAQTTWNAHANMIRLGPDVLSLIRSPEYTIYSESYTYFQQAYSGAFSQLQLLIPTRSSSLKTVFVVYLEKQQ